MISLAPSPFDLWAQANGYDTAPAPGSDPIIASSEVIGALSLQGELIQVKVELYRKRQTKTHPYQWVRSGSPVWLLASARTMVSVGERVMRWRWTS
jgi:hypothetical protein